MNPETTMASRIKEAAKILKLPQVHRTYESCAEQARRNELTYESYLLEILELEAQHRTNKRIERLLRESRLSTDKTLKSFDTKRLPPKVNAQVQALITGEFLRRRENILVFGNPGSGKTHLISAIAHELIQRGHKVLFTACSILVQQLLAAKRELMLPKFLLRLGKYDAIIIDDIGYVQQSRDEMEVLFTLLAERYERGSVLLTSNLPFSKWEMIFKDPMTTAAAIDRLVHHSVILELNLKSYRLETSIHKQEESNPQSDQREK